MVGKQEVIGLPTQLRAAAPAAAAAARALDRIAFEPLVYTVAGKKCTERFSLAFPSSGKMILNSVTETREAESRIEGNCYAELAPPSG